MGDEAKRVQIPYTITVRDLAKLLQSNSIQVMRILMANGVMANINQLVDFDTAAIVASEMGFEAVPESKEQVEEFKETGDVPLWRQIINKEDPKSLIPRPPVVTILGHVDHGKTSLLDAIRHTNVAVGEAGGITQHIGAYQIENKGKLITFLDTPGHAAFSAMRARGAQGADIVVLVVAANDGVMPQTKEAISHAKAAQVPIIVALNKIDRSDANPDLVKKQLSEQGLIPDEWGGNTMVVPVSAKQRIGIDDLMEAILLTAENSEILANPKGKVFGTVIEASIDPKKGVMATLLVQNGTLKMGDVVLAGQSIGKIRAMFDFRGKKIQKAGPSTPVQIMGLTEVPTAGDIFQVYASEKEARAVVENAKNEAALKSSTPKATLEELFAKFKAGEAKELNLIIKTDVNGSLEPIINSINDLSKEGEIKINILHAEAGNISENDVMLASASHGVVIGFNVQADPVAKKKAENEGVSIRIYDIIYRLIEDIEKALKGMLEPEFKETVIGRAEVLTTFSISKVGTIAGCRVKEGDIRRNCKVHVKRGNEIIFTGEISSLKHEKEDVKEVKTGLDCGIGLKGFEDFKPGDILEAFVLERFGM
ncbi:MAG TPA: translation initiation factor IF-2 [Flexilinea sp.]|jgi:translation initiation factor IF-2|nr:translation initiation factor IF-2 [Flexilinea sp.]OQA26238.1 MAG: Translation initiation factor IF-2 [Chloroflexi bacterium ADurb.Bin344]HNY94390.1 translation initiation factor IF-2 [Flexilinea sp.]HOG21332.1 translation initiation factor IF-2 [Flexilinea sp.]HOP01120.1 translation initiation factor IF-2 [Flexilinea sp.]